ncbi:MAG: leucyl aminopeptidase [Deltaproteobacteria bacterium]|nr:leucyl aminopeptidase [Deltaproteobacteria bacterium]
MQAELFVGRVGSARVDLVAVGVHAGRGAPSSAVLTLDRALGGALRAAMLDEEFKGKAKERLTLHTLGRLPMKRIGLIGLGPEREATLETWLHFAANATRLANRVGARSVLVVVPPTGVEVAKLLAVLSRGLALGAYRFDRLKSAPRRRRTLVHAMLALGDRPPGRTAAVAAVKRGSTIAAAVTLARDLANEPASELYPESFTARAGAVARQHRLAVRVFDPAALQRRGMRLILAVGAGSVRSPRLVHLTYRPPRSRSTLALVGKGITFDSGGLCLKQPASMADMKMDMSGAAVVLATLQAVARLRLPLTVHGVLALAENMPSGSAAKLGDVIESAAGKTVEIGNTDAEGRLVLADALHYATTLKPDLVVDVATLTAACAIALGPHTGGLFTPDDDVAAEILEAAAQAGEGFWRLPLTLQLRDQLKSEVADLKNTSERNGGAIAAALFLKEFVGDLPWAHLDIAGPAASAKDDGAWSKGGTGISVATLTELLRARAAGTRPGA